jgi:hypothetical protein
MRLENIKNLTKLERINFDEILILKFNEQLYETGKFKNLTKV